MSASNRSAFVQKCLADFLDCIGNGFNHQDECWSNGLTVKPLFRTEAYFENRLKIFFLLEWSKRSSFASCATNRLSNKGIAGRDVETQSSRAFNSADAQQSKIIGGYLGDLRSRYDEMVLVAGVQSLDAIKVLVPTLIRLEFFDRPDDLFSGERCLSIADGTLKPLLSVSEGKEHSLGVWGLVAHHAPSENVQRAFEVVDCIAQDKRDFVGNGLILFDENLSYAGLLFETTPEFKRRLTDISLDFGVQIVDVLFGPFNLETAWVD